MGGLFSRAYKRITQGNQQRSRNDSQSDQHAADSKKDTKPHARPLVESIPVGQSIDSAEYRALDGNQSQQHQDKENNNRRPAQQQPEKIKDVEEAVIKIQALVRGHLARKALKDANHPQPGSPSNGLGQSQFDEASLTNSNPADLRLQQQQQQQAAGNSRLDGRTPLESIAEVAETTAAAAAATGVAAQQTASELAELISKQAEQDQEKRSGSSNSNSNRQKLASICQSRAEKQRDGGGSGGGGGGLEWPSNESRDSGVSPVPSEANASIDLNTCDTPASASIDILDHNIQPTDRLATVLHPKQDGCSPVSAGAGKLADTSRPAQQISLEQVASGQQQQREVSIGTPDSLESEEVAAIRIQSAFRGYRTRKNSPYRTRSPPNSTITDSNNTKRDAKLRQQDALVVNDDDDDDDDEPRLSQTEESEAKGRIHDEGRRESRSKQRDNSEVGAKMRSSESIGDEAAAAAAPPPLSSEDAETVREATMTTSNNAGAGGPIDNEDDPEAASLSSFAFTEDLTAAPAPALEAAPSSTDDREQATPRQQPPPLVGAGHEQRLAPRGSLAGTKSADEAGGSFETDSSILGAALSLNDEISSASLACGGGGGGGGQSRLDKQAEPALAALEEEESVGFERANNNSNNNDDDPSLATIELESEARRLVAELEMDEKDSQAAAAAAAAQVSGQQQRQQSAMEDTLAEVTNQLEAALEEATASAATELSPPLLDDSTAPEENGNANENGGGPGGWKEIDAEKQLAIELESDDIERRDPRGQASEQRARSPQISTETEPVELVSAASEQRGGSQEPANGSAAAAAAAVAIEPELEASAEAAASQLMTMAKPPSSSESGRCSPACNSSNGDSSNGDDSDQPNQKEHQHQQQHHQQDRQPQSSGNKNNKKRNRNKKRAKK